ncbi:MAG TPA: hypothetical protein VIV11_09570 [Kofleriaceae bacterium]
MRVAVLLIAIVAACASSPRRDEHGGLPPSAGQDQHPCGGTGGLGGKLEVTQSTVLDPLGGEDGAIDITSCCRGVLLVDGEIRLRLNEDKLASLDVSAGRYRIALEFEGLRRYEVVVRVAAGERVVMTARR